MVIGQKNTSQNYHSSDQSQPLFHMHLIHLLRVMSDYRFTKKAGIITEVLRALLKRPGLPLSAILFGNPPENGLFRISDQLSHGKGPNHCRIFCKFPLSDRSALDTSADAEMTTQTPLRHFPLRR